MYEYDYSEVVLSLEEKYKLFVTRLRGKTTEKFLGSSKNYLEDICFIDANHSDKCNAVGQPLRDGTYSVSWYYKRYLIWRRHKIFYGILSSFITPVIVSIVISVLTVLVLRLLGLG